MVDRFEMEMMLEKKLNLAILAHRQDDVSRAEHLYEEILGIAPRHPHANHNLGVLLTSLKRTHEAIYHLRPLLVTELFTSFGLAILMR